MNYPYYEFYTRVGENLFNAQVSVSGDYTTSVRDGLIQAIKNYFDSLPAEARGYVKYSISETSV